MRLKNKVAIITGGASGIGKESCYLFAKEGAKVIIIDIDQKNGDNVAAGIKKKGGEATFIQTDVSKSDQVQRMVNMTKKKYGKIDVLFTNAFWYKVAPALELTDNEWEKTINVTLTGAFLCCKYVIKEMIETGGGSIINTASVGGVVGFDAHPAYNAAKGGIIMLTKNLAIDYGESQIRVNSISPGIIETPTTIKDIQDPETNQYYKYKCLTGQIGKPIDVAYMAVYLASDESSFVTGSNLFVDNGWTAK